MKFYNDFSFAGTWLTDICANATIYNKDGAKIKIITGVEHSTLDIPNQSPVFYKAKAKPKVIDFDIVMIGEVDDNIISAWLFNNGQEGELLFPDGRYINAVLNISDGIDISCFKSGDKDVYTYPVSFIAYSPYWRIKDEPKVISNEDIFFIGENNVDSYPLIKITPQDSKVVFKWNNTNVVLKDLTINREYFLDCENGEFYYQQGGDKVACMNSFFTDEYYTLPYLKPFVKNTIEMITGRANFEIDLRSRII